MKKLLLFNIFVVLYSFLFAQSTDSWLKRTGIYSRYDESKWSENGLYSGFRPQDEIMQYRTKDSKTFDNGDGTKTLMLVGDLHYLDINNGWQDIDITINHKPNGIYSYENSKNKFSTFYPSYAKDGIKVNYNNSSFELSKNTKIYLIKNGENKVISNGNCAVEQLDNRTISYNNFANNIDMQFIQLGSGIENGFWLKNKAMFSEYETLRIEQEISFPNNNDYYISTEIIGTQQTFIIKYKNGSNIITLNPIMVFDGTFAFDEIMKKIEIPEFRIVRTCHHENNNEEDHEHEELLPIDPSDSHKLALTCNIIDDNGFIKIYFDIPTSWLLSEEIIYPIFIDPDFTIGYPGSATSTSSYMFYNTSYYNQRLDYRLNNSILCNGGIQNDAIITQIGLLCSNSPGRAIGTPHIRLNNSTWTPSAWITTNWVDCYTVSTLPTPTVSASIWNDYIFSTNFTFNSSNGGLIINLSRQNSASTSGGGNYVVSSTLTSEARGGYQNGGTWPHNTISNSNQACIPATKLVFTGTPVSIDNITVSNITGETAVISWNDNVGSSAWVVEYGIWGFIPGTGSVAYASSTNFTLTGLTSLSHYQVYVYPQGSPFYGCGYVDFNTTCFVNSMAVTNVTGSSAKISWNITSANTNWVIEYGPSGFTPGTGLTTTSTSNFVILNGLQSITQYQVYVYAQGAAFYSTSCNYLDFATDCMTFISPACFNFTTFNVPTCVCRYGTWDDNDGGGSFWSSYSIGIVNNGPASSTSRHTIHTNPLEMDPRTGGLLHTIPQCSEASVRLGNWSTGGQTESITYEYTVNTGENELLVLKYAAVLESGQHSQYQQPRFTFKFLNSSGTEINPTCYSANFIAGYAQGWNYAGNNVYWKDWTTVAVDLEDLDGQTIFIQLTTYDCAQQQGAHYGYAYFTLACGGRKNLTAATCGNVTENTFYAPLGFNYRWYAQTNPTVTLSTTNALVVSGNGVYVCECSFVGSINCTFTLSATAGNRYPIADFDYIILDSCTKAISFINKSDVSADGITPNGTGETCETAEWNFGDGTTSNAYNPSHVYNTAGIYTVTLVSGLANNQCTDTIKFILDLTYNSVTTNENICDGAIYMWHGNIYSNTGIYKYVNNCGDTATLKLNVLPNYNTDIYAEICNGDTYNLYGFNASIQGVYTQHLFSVDGCDSIVKLHLTVNPTYLKTFTAQICEGEIYNGYGFSELTTSGVYNQNLKTIHGCDSIIILELFVYPNFEKTFNGYICEGSYYNLYGFYENQTGTYNQNLKTIHGCDSIVILNLTVYPKYNIELFADICEGNTYSEYNFSKNKTGIYTQNLLTQSGCDSIVRLNLTVHPTYNKKPIKATICEGDVYGLYGFDASAEGTYVQYNTTAFDCDSISTLILNVVSPNVNIIATPEITAFCDYGYLNLYANSSQKYIMWETGVSGPDLTIEHYGIYIVRVNDGNNCIEASDTIIIPPCPEDMDIPNVFTPNGDGVNDTWVINKIELFPTAVVCVFNRWGQRIFESKDGYKPWDGKYNNKKVPQGTYLYIIKLNRNEKISGTVTVIY